MPVIQPWYQSTYERGAPAGLSYLSAFLSERGAYNRQVMAARLAAQDPKHLREMLVNSQKNIAALEELRARLQLEDAAARGDVAGMLVRALGSYTTAIVNGEARVAEARISQAGRLEGIRLGLDDAARRSVAPGTDAQAALSAASALISEEGVAPEDTEAAYADKLAAVVNDARNSGEQAKVDGVLYAAWKQADREGHTAAARAFSQQLEGNPEGYMGRRYGAVQADQYDAAVQRTLGAGGLGARQDPMDLFYGVFGALQGGNIATEGATYPGDATGSYGAGLPGGAARSATPAISSAGVPAVGGGGGKGPPAAASAGLLDTMLPALDLGGVDAALTRERTAQQQIRGDLNRARTQPLNDGFGINYLTQNSRTRPHRAQQVIDAIAETQRRDPLAVEAGFDLLSRKGGPRLSPERAIEAARGDLAEEPPAPGGYQQLADGGDFLYAWLADESREIREALAQAQTPSEYAEATARYGALVETIREDLPVLAARLPGITRVLEGGYTAAANAPDNTTRATALSTALEHLGERARAIAYTDDDIHMGELVAEQLEQTLAIEDPQARVTAAARINTATAMLPTSLTGELGHALDKALNERATTGDLDGLDQDLRQLQAVADRRASESWRQAAERAMPQGPANAPTEAPTATTTYNPQPGDVVTLPADAPSSMATNQKEMSDYEQMLRRGIEAGEIQPGDAADALTLAYEQDAIQQEIEARRRAEQEARRKQGQLEQLQQLDKPNRAPRTMTRSQDVMLDDDLLAAAIGGR